VFDKGCSRGSEAFVIHAARNDLSWSRLGLMTGRRLGNAVARNFARRRIREAYRRLKADLPAGFDFVCIPRRVPRGDFREMTEELLRLFFKVLAVCEKREAESRPPPSAPRS
jgi:ribonuclease P protein component